MFRGPAITKSKLKGQAYNDILFAPDLSATILHYAGYLFITNFIFIIIINIINFINFIIIIVLFNSNNNLLL